MLCLKIALGGDIVRSVPRGTCLRGSSKAPSCRWPTLKTSFCKQASIVARYFLDVFTTLLRLDHRSGAGEVKVGQIACSYLPGDIAYNVIRSICSCVCGVIQGTNESRAARTNLLRPSLLCLHFFSEEFPPKTHGTRRKPVCLSSSSCTDDDV
ncbi:unnamed protein product [Ectocarpus sp. 12 AP-2014]